MADKEKVVVVFGATGHQGGSVVRALKKSSQYQVRAVTRDLESEKAAALEEWGCEVIKADLDDKSSLEHALHGAYAMFLCTNYWEYFSEEREYTQGINAVDVAKACGVEHVVYSGLEHVEELCGISCSHFDGKGRVEKYLENSGLTFTVVRLSFYMENLLSMAPLEKYSDGTYGISIPMGDAHLYMISVAQIGPIICGVLDDKAKYSGQILGLSGDHLTIQEMADTMTQILGIQVYDSKITLDNYCQLNFPGCKDLTAMFRIYQKEILKRDVVVSRMLNPELFTFADWLERHKQLILDQLK